VSLPIVGEDVVGVEAEPVEGLKSKLPRQPVDLGDRPVEDRV
jgi:hypothetical protein